jgi:single-strand DNA-binding protein
MSYSNINRIVIVGRLTADPELRALPSGSSVCSLRLASNSLRKNADGERTEKPNFFDVTVFGGMGESVHRYMSRGRRIVVDGRLEWREWETPEGAKRQAVEIVAD